MFVPKLDKLAGDCYTTRNFTFLTPNLRMHNTN
jgi:hypothetical protein